MYKKNLGNYSEFRELVLRGVYSLDKIKRFQLIITDVSMT